MLRDTERVARLGPMTPVMYRVRWRRQDLEDTVTLALEPERHMIDAPTPGQFNMLWAFGVGEAPISLAGEHDGLLVHTVRAVGAVTRALCASESGDQIGVRGPFGAGWPLDRAVGRDVLVVAGGLGLAPVRPIITHVLEQRADYGRVSLLVGARTPADLLYDDDLEKWAGQADVHLGVTVDAASPAWRGDVGVVTRLIDHAPISPHDTSVHLCGPEVMMRFAAQAVLDRGVAADDVWLSLERNMHCAVGHCGHCQLGPLFVCKDGPVLGWSRVEPLLRVRNR